MRVLLILFTIFLLGNTTSAQVIPNGSFEYWEAAGIHQKPVDWTTNQDMNHLRLEKDSLAINGDYSLKLIPSALTAWTDCNSIASLEARIVGQLGNNKSLYFFIRSEDLDSSGYTFSKVYVQLYLHNNFLGEAEWLNFNVIEDFTRIEIPIHYPEANIIRLYLFGGATNGPADGCHDLSYTWFDQVHIDQSQTSSNDDVLSANLKIFPNPAQGVVNIQGNLSDLTRWQVHNALGKQINSGILDGQPIPLTEKGLLILTLESKNGRLIQHKVLNTSAE